MIECRPGDQVLTPHGNRATVIATYEGDAWLTMHNGQRRICRIANLRPYVDPNVEKLKELMQQYDRVWGSYHEDAAAWLVNHGVRVEGT